MKFSGWTVFPPTVLDADLTRSEDHRPAGLHLSEIIQFKRQIEGLKCTPIDDAARYRFIEGFIWEVALEYMIAGMELDDALELAFKRYMVAVRKGITKQIKLLKDDIHMTPDGFDEKEGVLESYKMTRKNFKKAVNQAEFEEHFWPWMMQEASYCWAAGVDTARWIVLWQNGDYTDYKGPGTSDPKILMATAIWEPGELASNWREVLALRDAVEMSRGKGGQMELFS
jgi:hypothetical protein